MSDDWMSFGPAGSGPAEVSAPLPAGSPADVRTLAAATAAVLARFSGGTPRIALPDARGRRTWILPVAEDLSASRYLATLFVGASADEGPAPVAIGVADGGFPLVLDLDPADPQRLRCRFRREQVHETAARWLLHGVGVLLELFVRNPGAPLGSADLTAGEHPAPVLPGEAAPAWLDGEHTLHELIQRRVLADPDAIAVTAGSRSVSYRELGAAADVLAARLAARGCGPGSRVGLSFARSPELIAAMFAVLKTGAAYVPLAPGNPPARLRQIAEDAEVSLVLADAPAELGPPTLVVDGGVWTDRAEPFLMTGTADDGAYLIYTSGSTGQPKGVVVAHRQICSLLDAARVFGFGFGSADSWALFHTYSWDFSVWEIFGCLTTGGRLVIVPEETARDAHALHDLLSAEGVTVLNQTPSVFTQLAAVDAGRAERLSVRLLMFSGEPLDMALMLRWFERYPENGCQVINMYGITETTVACTWHPVTREAAAAGSRSVGRAVPGWRVDVVDERGRRVPPGVPGEILLGGAGIVDGYHRRPELTAAKFLGEPGARWYRTGDRGRVLPDGELEYLGRLDDQVKIRGHRVELGEIRAVLLAEPGVRAAAVVVRRRGTGAGSERLDAYVAGTGLDLSVVDKRLQEQLPEYMVPDTLTELAALPVNANGKLDPARLPEPRAVVADRGLVDAVEATELQLRVGELWSGALGRPITLDDDLFLTGGNSLLAFTIVDGIRKAGLGDLAVADLYRTRTVRGVAEILASLSPAGAAN
ncbi:non-ribosomal peptide synthetase [Amycolatopsis sp. RTGN1]|uniref:non-ribosomal peptide synthetase n=1 Tax=Amycolatopsis ponsaeliensis TaxID=2992142 RepID=UPI00254C8F09|nr:non-ribosomal peptide synthetase [Amycolatopsis sp. RTGN1]